MLFAYQKKEKKAFAGPRGKRGKGYLLSCNPEWQGGNWERGGKREFLLVRRKKSGRELLDSGREEI